EHSEPIAVTRSVWLPQQKVQVLHAHKEIVVQEWITGIWIGVVVLDGNRRARWRTQRDSCRITEINGQRLVSFDERIVNYRELYCLAGLTRGKAQSAAQSCIITFRGSQAVNCVASRSHVVVGGIVNCSGARSIWPGDNNLQRTCSFSYVVAREFKLDRV